MKYRTKISWIKGYKYYPKVQVRKWYGWVTIKKFPAYNVIDPENEYDELDPCYGYYFPNGKRNITYSDLCAEELLDKLNENVE